MTEIASGLSANKNVTSSELIRFLWEQLNLHCQEKYNSSESSTANPGKYLSYQEDTFIVPSAKKQAPRQGAVGVVAVVSWFVYSCLYNLLKKESVEPDAETLKILDLFAKHIVDGKNDETLEVKFFYLQIFCRFVSSFEHFGGICRSELQRCGHSFFSTSFL